MLVSACREAFGRSSQRNCRVRSLAVTSGRPVPSNDHSRRHIQAASSVAAVASVGMLGLPPGGCAASVCIGSGDTDDKRRALDAVAQFLFNPILHMFGWKAGCAGTWSAGGGSVYLDLYLSTLEDLGMQVSPPPSQVP